MSIDVIRERPAQFLPPSEELRRMYKFAEEVAQSGMAGYKATASSVLAIAVAGRELGLPFMSAVRAFHVIEGKPSPSADLLFALIKRRYGGNAMRIISASESECTIRYRDPDWPEGDYQEHTVTMEQAKRLKWDHTIHRDGRITPKDNWKYHPAEMLKARAITQVAHLAFPEIVLNLYTPDELGSDISPGGEHDPEATLAIITMDESDATPDAAPEPSSQATEGVFREVADDDELRYDAGGNLINATTGELLEPAAASEEIFTIERACDMILSAGSVDQLVRMMNETIAKHPVKHEEAVKGQFQARLKQLKEAGRVTP